MTRELVASAALARDQLPLLTLHRHVPERSLPELLTASGRVQDPVRLELFHLQACAVCSEETACPRGARLLAACHGWRPRSEAAP